MILFRSLVFYFNLALATILFSLISLIILPLPFPLRYRIMARWADFNLWQLRWICRLDYRVEGTENIPPGSAIILCKHQSAWETLALQQIFPIQVWVLKRELLRIPVYGWGLASMNPISIDRSAGTRALKEIVRQGMERLRKGWWVVIFPEGTRTTPGQRRKYQPGGAMLAEKSGCPIVPVAHNAGWFWPKNSLRKYPGTITLVIGPPIEPAGKSAKQIITETETWIESAVAVLPVPDKK